MNSAPSQTKTSQFSTFSHKIPDEVEQQDVSHAQQDFE